MWNAVYKAIDKSGFDLELKITVEFSNGQDTQEKVYDVLLDDLNSDVFKQVVQTQLDILNAKENIQSLDALVNTEVTIQPLK